MQTFTFDGNDSDGSVALDADGLRGRHRPRSEVQGIDPQQGMTVQMPDNKPCDHAYVLKVTQR